MRPIDSIFIILVFSSYLKSSKKKYIVSIIPFLAFALSLSQSYIPPNLESFVLPIAAILICLISLELAPIGLILLFSEYGNWWEVLMIPFIYFVVTWLMKNQKSRIDADYIPPYLRGFPIRLIVLGILYFIFYPLMYL